MDKFFVVFKREYLERVRSKWFLIVTLLGPVFFGVITVLPIVLASRTKTSDDLANVAVIDATSTDLGQRVVNSIARQVTSGPRPTLQAIPASDIERAESLATRRVMNREIKGYLLLDASTIAGQSVKYAGRNASSVVDVQTLNNAVRQSLLGQRFEKEGISSDRVITLTAVKMDSRTEKISDRGREGAGGMTSLFFGYGISLLLYMMIAVYGQNILRGVMEEKTTRVAEVVVSSVRTDTLLAGKVLGVGSVALTQVFAWMAMTFLIYQKRGPILEKFGVPAEAMGAVKMPSVSPGIAVALLAFFIIGFILYAALFAAVGAMVNNQEDAQQAAMPVMLLLITCVIFMQPTLLNPSSTMARTASWIPFAAPILMPLRMAMTSISWVEIVGSLAGVTVMMLLCIWLSARIYRVGLLMYGKKPGFGELLRWVRSA